MKYIGNAVINHKVEQIVRAICVEPNILFDEGILAPRSLCGQLTVVHQPYDLVLVGIADEYGYRFAPETNSALAQWGYHANAILHRLNATIVDGVPALVEQDGNLYALFSAVVAVAYECSYVGSSKHKTVGTYEAVLANYLGSVRKYGHPKHFAVSLYATRKTKDQAKKFKALR